jgi:hypothetical protein
MLREADILYRTLTDRATVTREVWNGARWVTQTVYEGLACALSRVVQAGTPKLRDEWADVPETMGRAILFLPAGTVLKAGDRVAVIREAQVFRGICSPSLPYPSHAVATLYLQEVEGL